ncbi:hypothetical protein [Actinomadura sp. 9N407]|uniref:hypothetical protein n=1 Tax=Actinomadura sp. 9N407 TaxID=3375154 RepID=UPI00379E284E
MKRLSMLLVVPLLALVACGGGSSGDGAASAAPSDAANLKYNKCLRENGANMPDDPKDIPQGGVEIPDKAVNACKGLVPPGQTIDMKDPAVRERFARFGKCMRENGFDMPDDAPPDIHLKDPAKWEKASKVCSPILQEGRK